METVTFTRKAIDDRHATSEGAEIGNRIRIAFRDARLAENQTEIARAMKVSPMTVSYWMRGIKIPPIHTGVMIAKKTGVRIEWLYSGKGPKYPQPLDASIDLADTICKAPHHLVKTIMMMLKNEKLMDDTE